MVRPRRLERLTSASARLRSIQLSYGRITINNRIRIFIYFNAPLSPDALRGRDPDSPRCGCIGTTGAKKFKTEEYGLKYQSMTLPPFQGLR